MTYQFMKMKAELWNIYTFQTSIFDDSNITVFEGKNVFINIGIHCSCDFCINQQGKIIYK